MTAAPDMIRPLPIRAPALDGASPRRGWRFGRHRISFDRSPLARKIIGFNMLALVILVAGVLFQNPFRDSIVLQRERGLVTVARLVANAFEAQIGALEDNRLTAPTVARGMLRSMDIGPGVNVFVFGPRGDVIAVAEGRTVPGVTPAGPPPRATILTDALSAIWNATSGMLASPAQDLKRFDAEALARTVLGGAARGATTVDTGRDPEGGTIFSVATPIWREGAVMGIVALTSAEGEIDALVRTEREQVLQMFVIAVLVSIGLSLVLASTIATPLSDLARAAELGQDHDTRRTTPGRVRIPDLAARPDEIGRLSVAMRGMVAALYDRIDANEQFAADVAHEIKNPLASLRSAVGTLRIARRDDQRERLLGVIEHDVRRLDRLVSDISNASRLDSDLVKEEEGEFDLVRTLHGICEHLGRSAAERGVGFSTDVPGGPIPIRGLEGRLAQVLVNVVTNAVSFCEAGDAVRVWARQRDDRVLVVVEDTGPGIPEQALTKVFTRFYSERPVAQFGNHSGLGLAISKQIVEAHGGVIWAENIRPTRADATSEPLGARFVIGLPV